MIHGLNLTSSTISPIRPQAANSAIKPPTEGQLSTLGHNLENRVEVSPQASEPEPSPGPPTEVASAPPASPPVAQAPATSGIHLRTGAGTTVTSQSALGPLVEMDTPQVPQAAFEDFAGSKAAAPHGEEESVDFNGQKTSYSCAVESAKVYLDNSQQVPVSIEPGADGRDWPYGALQSCGNSLLQLGPALMALNGGAATPFYAGLTQLQG